MKSKSNWELRVCHTAPSLAVRFDHASYETRYFPVSMTFWAIACRSATVLNGSYLHSRRKIANCERNMSPSAQAAITILAALSIFSMAPDM